MTNILIEGLSHIPSYDLTVKDFERFAKVIPINVRAKLTRYITSKDISWCDILICVRANNPISATVAKKAKRAGRKVILVLDDDLLCFSSDQHRFIDSLMKKSLIRVLGLCTNLITTSRYLGEKYKKEFKVDYILSDTAFDNTEILHPLPSDDRVHIVYAASPGHIVFYNKLIAPIVKKIFDRYGEKVSLTIIGPQIKDADSKFGITNKAPMPMDEYQYYMKTHHFDIGLAPLLDTELCRSKYFNKYFEYTKNNIFGIYANQLPYTNVITDGKNGLLASETSESWYFNICKAIDNSELRQKGVIAAQQHITLNFSPESISSRLLHAMPELSTFKAKSYPLHAPYFLYVRFLFYELIRRSLFLLNRASLGTVGKC